MKHKLTTAVIFCLAFCLISMPKAMAQDSARTIQLKEAIVLSVNNSHLLKNNKAIIMPIKDYSLLKIQSKKNNN